MSGIGLTEELKQVGKIPDTILLKTGQGVPVTKTGEIPVDLSLLE